MTEQPSDAPAGADDIVHDTWPVLPRRDTDNSAAEPDAKPATDNEPADREWWDDPSLPWRHKPTRADLACWGWITAAGVYGLAMAPLRAWLLTVPYFSAILTGSRAALVAIGAFVTARHDPMLWWLPTLLLAALSALKWDWLYWWAGKLWGHNLIEVWTKDKPRYQALARKLEAVTRRHPVLAMILTYLPIPMVAIVYVVMGASGVKLRTFLLIDYCIALVNVIIMFVLGVKIGHPAVDVLNVYTKYAMWLGFAILGVMIVSVVLRQRKQNRAVPEPPVDPPAK